MNINYGRLFSAHTIILKISLKTVVFILFLAPLASVAAQENQNEEQLLLSQIVSATVRIMRSNGYEMPSYRVRSGGTDVPISGPPEKYPFVGYLEKSWLQEKPTIVLYFYEANHLPLQGRKELINYLVSLHDEKEGGFVLSLRMTGANRKKLQLIEPEYFFEMKLN